MNILRNRGVQASAAAGVTIATLALVTDQYRPVWAALGALWLVATVVAVVLARRRPA